MRFLVKFTIFFKLNILVKVTKKPQFKSILRRNDKEYKSVYKTGLTQWPQQTETFYSPLTEHWSKSNGDKLCFVSTQLRWIK